MSTDKGGDIGAGFMLGLVASAAIFVIIAIAMPVSPSNEVIVEQRIEPEWRLQTDGKEVDTLFIYKTK